MKAYRITSGQVSSILNQKFADSSYFHPVKDINGDWFIFEIEMESAVKNKGWARATLAEYIPPPTEAL